MAAGDVTVRVDLGDVLALLTAIWGKLGTVATQDDIDRITAALTDAADQLGSGQQAIAANVAELRQAVTDLAADIDAIKAAAPEAVDATNLQSSADRIAAAANALNASAGQLTTAVDSAQQLAAENPPPAPPAP